MTLILKGEWATETLQHYKMRFPTFYYKMQSTPGSSPRLHPDGLIAGAPPCSLFTAASSSVHKRTKLHPCGDLGNFKVRLAQRIWGSFVTRILQDFYSLHLLLLEHVLVFHAVPICTPPGSSMLFQFHWDLLHPLISLDIPLRIHHHQISSVQNGTSWFQDLPRWCFWCWSCSIPQLCDWWWNSHVARGGSNNCSSSPWLPLSSSSLSKPTWVFSVTTCANAVTSWRTWGLRVMDHKWSQWII